MLASGHQEGIFLLFFFPARANTKMRKREIFCSIASGFSLFLSYFV